MSNNISSVAYNLIKDDLDVSALRNKVIANNISNINTDGYKRKYVSFEDTLQNTIKSVRLKTTSEKHISSSNESGYERIITDNSTSTRSDGNLSLIHISLGKVTYQLTEKQRNSREHSRSLFVVKDIKSGEKFTEENVRSIRPGFGMETKYIDDIIGREAKVDIEKGTPMSWDLIR